MVLAPFGEERKCAHRLLVRLSRACAAWGLAVLRFDYSGTGESTGAHEAAQLTQWLADSQVALSAVRAACPGGPWLVIGARLGANLAVRLACAEAVTRVVLIEPLLRGADYLRDLQRRQQIKDMMMAREGQQAPPEAPEARWAAGQSVDFGGFPVGAELAEQLGTLSLGTDVDALPDSCRVQLLRVSGGKTFPAAWQGVADSVSARAGSCARIVRDKPFWGQLEYYESDVIIDEVMAYVGGADGQ